MDLKVIEPSDTGDISATTAPAASVVSTVATYDCVTFLDLPVEIRDKISHHLRSSDLLNARLINSSFSRSVAVYGTIPPLCRSAFLMEI